MSKTIKQKFIIDESGSMLPQQGAIISGFNEQISTMKSEEAASDGQVKYLVTLVKFADKAVTVFKDKPLSEVALLTSETYYPYGWTALLDAIGMTIDKALPGESDTIVTIMTDGQENMSKIWKKLAIKTLIELRQRENKWGFIFFGANQDAWAEAQSMGIMNAVNYAAANTGAAMKGMSMARSCYTSSSLNNTYNSLDSLADDIEDLT